MKIIKDFDYLKSKKKYLINNIYNKGLSFKELYEQKMRYKQSVNKKTSKMTPLNSQNDTLYSSLYSNLEKESYSTLNTNDVDKVQIEINWKGIKINTQQKKYFMDYQPLKPLERAKQELISNIRMEKPIESHFAYLHYMTNYFKNERI
jgi:hypothetical protein